MTQQMGTATAQPMQYGQHKPFMQPTHHISTIISTFKDRRYTGSIEQSWEDTVRTYDGICDSYALDDTVRMQHLGRTLDGPAETFYNKQVKNKISSYQQAVTLIQNIFNDRHKQTRHK